ncbi:MAG TPA: TIGR04282 family arsenosugar biosynthesis glycosyltransferase, partial [Burkholderiaceae bacterium]
RDSAVGPVELWVAGDPGHPFVRACARRFGAALRVQRGADLGQRMSYAFECVLAQASRCVLIGTDCPGQTGADLQRAAAALRRRDVVLQPAEDGGYVLVGLREPRPELFDGVAWGGADVLAQTERRIAALGLAQRRLRRLPDLDTVEDYRRAQRHGWIAG